MTAVPVDLEAVRARYDDHMILWEGLVEAMTSPLTAAGAVTIAAAASAADVPDLRAEVERLTKLTATCVCYDGNPGNYEGPLADCPVHGAVRAFNEATREIERLRPIVEAAREFGTLVLRGSWSEEQAAEFIAATQARGEVR